jgi:tripartite-type tricarboxylate transporter receptor subunit TctC
MAPEVAKLLPGLRKLFPDIPHPPELPPEQERRYLFNGMLATWPHVTGGRLKALAISSAQRVPSAADTPTVAEQGLPGFETGSYQGLVGPAGIPRETVTKLNAQLIKVLNTPEMKERFAKQGTEVRTDTPENLGKWMTTEQAKWAKVVKESGAKFE